MRRARDAGARLRAEFIATGRNRQMYVTYKFAGFREVERDGTKAILEAGDAPAQDFPPYIEVIVDEGTTRSRQS
jgi:hypothetical protein